MRKRMLADVLWDAANKWLFPDESGYYAPLQWFSCNAVGVALDSGEWVSAFTRNPEVANFLKGLGCNVHSNQCFREYDSGEVRQGVRYMWLLLAMHVAEDEGITV